MKPKKTGHFNMRLTEVEAALFSQLAEESGLQLSEIVRRLLRAAIVCFNENDGWPREIAVVKKPAKVESIEKRPVPADMPASNTKPELENVPLNDAQIVKAWRDADRKDLRDKPPLKWGDADKARKRRQKIATKQFKHGLRAPKRVGH
jgi:hypothetical protein